MHTEQIIQASLILLAGAWTPGPNNAMLSASAANFGLRATQPHILGIIIGFPLMMFLTGLGLNTLLEQAPFFETILHILSTILLLYIGYKIATAPVDNQNNKQSSQTTHHKTSLRPLHFHEALAFQWVNPKAWMVAIAINAQYANPQKPLTSASIFALSSMLISITAAQGWATFGTLMAKLLHTPLRRRLFNLSMAALIIIPLISYLLLTSPPAIP